MSQPDAAITILSDMRKGVPRLCVPAQSRGLASVTHNEANLRGMRRTSICKSVRFRLAYIIIGTALFPARPRAIPPASALRQLALVFLLELRRFPGIPAIGKLDAAHLQRVHRTPGDFFIQPEVSPELAAFSLNGGLPFFHPVISFLQIDFIFFERKSMFALWRPLPRAFSRTSVRALRPRPLFCVLFSPARAARTDVRTPLGTALSVPAENCSQPGQC